MHRLLYKGKRGRVEGEGWGGLEERMRKRGRGERWGWGKERDREERE